MADALAGIAPPHLDRLRETFGGVIVSYNHSGDAGRVERDVAPLRSGPEPVTSTDGSYPYLEVQTAHVAPSVEN
jgi:hypothetical protein